MSSVSEVYHNLDPDGGGGIVDVLKVSFDKDKWIIENLVHLGEEFNSEQRIQMCDAITRYAQILKELELEHSNTPE